MTGNRKAQLVILFLLLIGCTDAGPARPPRPPSDSIFSPKIHDTAYVEQRIDQGLNPNAKNNAFTNQDYLITYAVRNGAAETVRFLLSSGADGDISDSIMNKTPLFQAAYDNELDIAKFLVEHSAD